MNGRIFTIILIAAFTVSQAYAQDQIPNSGFENWTDEYHADSWMGLNVNFGPVVFNTFSRTTDAHGGNYAAKVENVTYFGEVIPGAAFSGDLYIDYETFEYEFSAGVPISGRPTGVNGYYKYQPQEGDTMAIVVGMFRWNEQESKLDSIGGGYFYTANTVSSYTSFNVPIEYFIPDVDADTMYVLMLPALEDFHEGSTMYVDDLTVEYGAAGVNKNREVSAEIYPVPAREALTVTCMENIQWCKLYDGTGRLVKQVNSVRNNMVRFDLQGFDQGIYLLKGQSENGLFSEKIIVN